MDVKLSDASIVLAAANGAGTLAVLGILATDSETLRLLVVALRQAYVGYALGMTAGALGAFFRYGWKSPKAYEIFTLLSLMMFMIAPWFTIVRFQIFGE
ncbi:MAG: hypothetical protein GKS03_04655 [Alphaproteobacteria bacterium]|nr:hypothetical protein [Alphaproteobacteria bacterium]